MHTFSQTEQRREKEEAAGRASFFLWCYSRCRASYTYTNLSMYSTESVIVVDISKKEKKKDSLRMMMVMANRRKR